MDRDAGRAVVVGQAHSPRKGAAERKAGKREVTVAAEPESGQEDIARETETKAAKETGGAVAAKGTGGAAAAKVAAAKETGGAAAAKETHAKKAVAAAASNNRKAEEEVERRGQRGGSSGSADPAEFAPAIGDRIEAQFGLDADELWWPGTVHKLRKVSK